MGSIEKVTGYGAYPISVRVWRPAEDPRSQLIILHGVVSHSEWLTPIAERLVARGIEVICPDRRGAGLNDISPGNAPSLEALLEDVLALAEYFKRPAVACHLAGFCWGGNYAISFVSKHSHVFESLILIAPAVFSLPDVAGQHINTGDSQEATEEPVIPLDRFTRGPDYENYILPDPLRTRAVSRKFNSIVLEIADQVGPQWAAIRLPTLLILAEHDRISDNEKLARAFRILRGTPKTLKVVTSEHGVQFDAPEETAELVSRWIRSSD